ncbi:hypothetical protein WJX77_006679 [Trebouxia sp. C0004]
MHEGTVQVVTRGPLCGDALWTFDINEQTWQKRNCTGLLPIPELALGLAVANGCAYVLANAIDHAFMPDHARRMEVYELNLDTWHWRLLPCEGQAAFCATEITPVVVQGQWLVFGGFPVPAEDEMTKIIESHTLQPVMKTLWVVVGGLLPAKDRALEDYGTPQTVQVIRLSQNPPKAEPPDITIMRYNMDRDISSMFKRLELADTVLAVEGCGQRWWVHRLVLASASRVFRDAFESDEESKVGQHWTSKQPTDDAVMVHKLELPDVLPESVSLMLDFLYGDFKASLTFAEAVALFCASHKYGVTELEQQCERALLALTSQQTIYELVNVASQYDSPALRQACGTYMEQADEDQCGYMDAQRMRIPMLRAGVLAQDKPDCTSFALDHLCSHTLTDLDNVESCGDDAEELSMPAETDDGGNSPVGDHVADIDMIGSSSWEWTNRQTAKALDATASGHLESHQIGCPDV